MVRAGGLRGRRRRDEGQRFLLMGASQYSFPIAGIAQLGEQQTEVLEVPCSIHGPGKAFFYLPVQIH